MGTFLGGVMLDRRTYRSRAVAGVTLVAVDVATDEVLPTLSLVDQATPSPVTTNGDGAYSDFYIADRDIARLTSGGVSQVVVSAEVLQGQARSLAQPVATAADLPAVERDGSLRITQDDLHLWVWEDAVPGWTDLGSLKGQPGAGSSDAEVAGFIEGGSESRAAVQGVITAFGVVKPAVAEKTVFVTPRGSDEADGFTLTTAKATVSAALNALNGSGVVQLGVGSMPFGPDATYAAGTSVRGCGTGLTVLTYSGSGTALRPTTPGVRTFYPQFHGFDLVGPGKTSSAVGLDLDSVTSASVKDVTVRSFGTGIRIASAVNGGAVFNQFENVTASNCSTGFAVHAMGSNANRFFGCRANACTIGVDIVDANNVTWIGGQIEVCTLGVKVTATSVGFADANAFHFTRFESNTTAWEVTSANVRDFQVLYPNIFAAYTIIDNGLRTTHLGNLGAAIGNKWVSAATDTAGAWFFERVVNGGTGRPMFRLRDGVSTSGDPVTLQVEMERATAAAAFAKFVRGGNTYWSVNGLGHMYLRNRTTAPTAAVAADGGVIYVQSGALMYMGSSGTATTLAPA